ncbi:MAG TPA: hypothetical protein VGD76_03845 [Ramlibacter sp.]
MNACIAELKTRARIALKTLRAGDTALVQRASAASGTRAYVPGEWQLRHALALVAQAAGFRHWDHARIVLGGEARAGEDMGRFWHAPACDALLNQWFARYPEAAECLRATPGSTLLTFGRQFVVVGAPYLREIGVVERLPDAANEQFDAVAQYGAPRWLQWCEARLRAPAPAWAS